MDEWHQRAGLVPQTRPTYGQTRNPVTPSGREFRAKFFSWKNRRLVRCESVLIFDTLFLTEFAPGIHLFEEQPITVKYRLGWRKRRYAPNFGVELRNGRRWFIEVKRSENLAKPPNAEQFDEFSKWFASKGGGLLDLTE